MYRVVDWQNLYENNRSKEIAKLDWVPFKNRHDGDGITELLDHPNGMAHLGAWVLLVQVASRCGKPAGKCGAGEYPRGTLWRDIGKPHDARSIARMTGANLTLLEEALPRFLDIKWLEVIPDPPTTSEIPQASAALPQAPAGFPQEGAAPSARANSVPFSSIPEGGVGETKPAPQPPAGALRPAVQADYTRAMEVLKLYPSQAKKDKRVIVKDLPAQNLLAVRIAANPDYPWEEHAKLVNLEETPKNAHAWAMGMPDTVALENLRSINAPTPRKEYYR